MAAFIQIWAPIAVALCALGASIGAMAIQRKHNRLSVVPHIDVGLDDNYLYLENNGLGPARIMSFKGTVGDTTYDLGILVLATACAMELLLGESVPGHVDVGSIPAGTHLRAGDRIPVYRSEASTPEELVLEAARRLELRVEYESLYGEVQEPCRWGPAALGDLEESLEELLKR